MILRSDPPARVPADAFFRRLIMGVFLTAELVEDLQLFLSLPLSSHVFVYAREKIVNRIILRIGRSGKLELPRGFLIIMEEAQRLPPLLARFDEVRFESDCDLEVAGSLFDFAPV